jgi:hypothetical protein
MAATVKLGKPHKAKDGSWVAAKIQLEPGKKPRIIGTQKVPPPPGQEAEHQEAPANETPASTAPAKAHRKAAPRPAPSGAGSRAPATRGGSSSRTIAIAAVVGLTIAGGFVGLILWLRRRPGRSSAPGLSVVRREAAAS